MRLLGKAKRLEERDCHNWRPCVSQAEPLTHQQLKDTGGVSATHPTHWIVLCLSFPISSQNQGNHCSGTRQDVSVRGSGTRVEKRGAGLLEQPHLKLHRTQEWTGIG